jgi:hypothetical protein
MAFDNAAGKPHAIAEFLDQITIDSELGLLDRYVIDCQDLICLAPSNASHYHAGNRIQLAQTPLIITWIMQVMRILFDMGHPAHVHCVGRRAGREADIVGQIFWNAIRELEGRGHSVKVTAREKGTAPGLLKA